MKKIALLLVSTMLPFCLFAQEDPKTFQLGFTLSPNLGWANMGDSNYSSDGVKLGVSYGVLGDFGFASNYFFSTGFTLSNISAKTTLVESGTTDNTTYKIQYIEIPLTLKLKTNDRAGQSFYGQFGLSTGIKTRARADMKVTDSFDKVISSEKNTDVSSSTNLFRLGLVAGAGVQWNYNENSKITTGVTLNNGFTKVLDGQPQFQSAYLAFSLGVFF